MVVPLPTTDLLALLAAVPLEFFVVLIEIIRSNIAVARIILGSKERQQNPGFMQIPIEYA